MTVPTRIQLKRTRGWRKPANTVVVSRPSKWGNPFSVMRDDGQWVVVSELAKDLAYGQFSVTVWKSETREAAVEKAVELFREALVIGDLSYELHDVRVALAGKNLACWCKGSPCHADTLLEIANGGAP